jgi:predicted transcriptional regulator
MMDDKDHIDLAAQIVSSYVANNSVRSGELPALFEQIHGALTSIYLRPTSGALKVLRTPAVTPRKSITHEYLICLEDGRKFQSLKRHLRTRHNLTPEQYREKWNLPSDYPMVAPAYATARSTIAKKSGLGQRRWTPKNATSR